MLNTYKAIDVIDVISESSGRTKPWVVLAETPNGIKPFVVKLFTAYQVDAANSVTNEVIGNALAKEFDFCVLEIALIDIPEDLAMSKGAELHEKQFKKNEIVKTKHLTIKFDLSWKKDTNVFIKPLSFDLSDEISIQHKAAIIYSQLIELAEYAKVNKSRFDLLIAKPQIGFNKEFANALDFIDSAKAPKNLITEDKWLNYTQQTIQALA